MIPDYDESSVRPQNTSSAGPTLAVDDAVLDLSNMEKRMLAQLAQEGGPLWKVRKYFVDYGAGLRQALASANLDDPVTLKAARKVQSNLQSCVWLVGVLDNCFTPEEELEPQDD